MNDKNPFQDCWFLTGATATGKTRVGIELARLLNAEVISLDSMSVYRGMDIGTAKPTPAQQAEVPHHLIDIRDPQEEYSLAEYVRDAQRVVVQLESRGKRTLFVGGTPLYLKALLRGLDPVPPPDPEFRRAVWEELAQIMPEELHRRVAQIDPLAASQLHPHDTKRLIRVMEVFKQTGKPLSHFQMSFEEQQPQSHAGRVFALRRERAELHQRIEARVDEMFAEGLVEEVEGLMRRKGPDGSSEDTALSRTARQAVGYREVISHLEGELDLATAVEKTKIRTRRFARRQETWFRSLAEISFIDLSGCEEPNSLADAILKTPIGEGV